MKMCRHYFSTLIPVKMIPDPLHDILGRYCIEKCHKNICVFEPEIETHLLRLHVRNLYF